MSSVTSARDGDGDGEHPLMMVMLKEMMLMLMLPPMLILMALSFTAIMSMCIFFLPRAIKSNRDNYAGGLIDKTCLTCNQCPILAIAPRSDARAPGTFGGGRELGGEAHPLRRNPLNSCAERLDPSEHEAERPFRGHASNAQVETYAENPSLSE